MKIVVNIDRVALRGVDAAQREEVVAELRESLIDQINSPDAARALCGLGHRAALRATIPAPSGPFPEPIGKAAGAAIGRALKR